MARFMPIVRTFVPVVAGIGKMPYRRFASFNIIGGAAWVLSMTVAGYFLGQIEFVKKHIELMVIGIIVLSVLPGFIAWLNGRKGDGEKKGKDQELADKKAEEEKEAKGGGPPAAA